MVHIRGVQDADCAALLALMKKSAETRGKNVSYDLASLYTAVLVEKRLKAYVADWNGTLAGYCLYQECSQPFSPGKGISVLDEYVLPEYRHNDLGKGFLQTLGMVGQDRPIAFLKWERDAADEKERRFYMSMGAESLEGQCVFFVPGDRFTEFAAHCSCCGNKPLNR